MPNDEGEGECIISEMNSHTTHMSPQATARAVGNDLRREAWSRMKPRGTRSSVVAAAEELQAFPSSRLFNRTAVESSRTSEYCPSNRAMVPLHVSRIFVPSYRPSSCRRRL